MTFKDCIYHIQLEQKSTVADTVSGVLLIHPPPPRYPCLPFVLQVPPEHGVWHH